jgi:protease PrsW
MTDIALSPGREAQRVAIQESGWGHQFRFFQPHNLAFWVYLLGVGGGALGMWQYYAPGAGLYAPALTGGVLLFGIYLIPWLLLLRSHNRYTRQPAGLLATGFVWGGIAAGFWIAMPANTALVEIWTKIGGTSFAADWAAGLTAPIDEEFGKAIGLILLIGLASRLVRSAYDGFIIGAFIGLGFEVFEDILYIFNGAANAFGTGQGGVALHMFLLRGASGITSHALFSAIFCAGLMWTLGRVPGERNVLRGVLTMLMAMVFHFAWDDMIGLGGAGIVTAILPFILIPIELAGLFYVLRHAARQERVWTRDLLAPEVETGALDPALLDAVSGLRKDRKAYRKQLHSRHKGRHLIEAANDLAQEIALANGQETRQVTHARAELTRLREAA